MATKTDFTTEEWAKLVESAMLASMAITAAEPHGLWGFLQEGWAMASGIASARSNPSPLVNDVAAALGTPEGRTIAQDQLKARLTGAKPADVVQRSVGELREVAKLVDTKAGSDAAPFKQWLYANAKRVAEAGTEGGFLGFGGVQVSDNEKATLAQLAEALGLPREAAAA
jgi:hypothetical protein